MANIGILSGLAAGLDKAGNLFDRQMQQDNEDARLEKKLKLARDMQLDVLKAKQEWAKANPIYKNFMKTDGGDIVGTTDQGYSSVVHAASDADKEVINTKLANQAAFNNWRIGNGTALLDPSIALKNAQADAARARALKDARDPQPKGPIVDAATYAKRRDALANSIAMNQIGIPLKDAILPASDYKSNAAILADPNSPPAKLKRAQEENAAHDQAMSIVGQADKELQGGGYKVGARVGLAAPTASSNPAPANPFMDDDEEETDE